MQNISWWKTNFGKAEIKKLEESVFSEHISQGEVTEEFEKLISQALDIPYVVVTTSGSVSLMMALISLDIGHGDEVIIPNRTWIATAHSVLATGAKVVLADVVPEIPLIDYQAIEEKITSRTKAIIPVHINGRSANMNKIANIAEKNNLYVIEDACQAFFSKNDNGFLGTQSDIGCFSLGVTKLISTGQGGIIVTKNKNLYNKLTLIRNHGVNNNFSERWNQMGYNFKFTDLQASFGLVQLERSTEKIRNVKLIYSKYLEKLKSFSFIKLIPVNITKGELPLYVEALSDERNHLTSFLTEFGIQTRPFTPNLHTAAYLNNINGYFPNSLKLYEKGFYLPCGPDFLIDKIEYIIDKLNIYKNEYVNR